MLLSQVWCLDTGVRVVNSCNTSLHMRWLTSREGKQFLLSHDGVFEAKTESEFSTNHLTHDPISCLAAEYREKIITSALYSTLSPSGSRDLYVPRHMTIVSLSRCPWFTVWFVDRSDELASDLQLLDLCSLTKQLTSADSGLCAASVVDEKARWWTAVILCAREWNQAGASAEAEKYYSVITSLPLELRSSVLANSLLNAFKVSTGDSHCSYIILCMQRIYLRSIRLG